LALPQAHALLQPQPQQDHHHQQHQKLNLLHVTPSFHATNDTKNIISSCETTHSGSEGGRGGAGRPSSAAAKHDILNTQRYSDRSIGLNIVYWVS
jgi:hypothetical protein